ncbi:SpoIID/LytB domain-containing protein [Phycicoccus ginsengisoli]
MDHGWTAAMILDHYYGGTSAGSLGAPSIRVALTSLDGALNSTSLAGQWITSTKEFTVGGITIEAGSAARVVRTSSGAWQLYATYQGCSAPRNIGPYALTDTVIKLTPKAGTTADDTLVTCGNGKGYRGTLEMVQDGSTRRLVNELPLEEYLRGVVPSESPAGWADAREGWGIEALKAQAVAARSYAWSERRWSYAKTCDTTTCQVYNGATRNGVLVADPRTDKAIGATAGQVRVMKSTGAVARTEFSASTGGYTAGGTFPAVPDLGDRWAPEHTWTVTLDGSVLASRYALGTFKSLRVTQQNGLGTTGGRVTQVVIAGSTGTRTLTGTAFQAAFGLKSDWFFPVVQPSQQVTSLAYVKSAFGPEVYRQFGAGQWKDHAWVTATDYAAVGRPRVSAMPTRNVKYAWSPTQYAVIDWPTEPLGQTRMLTWDQWKAAGFPTPQVVGLVYGTLFYRTASDPAIYAEAPDGTLHHMSQAEMRAAGWPAYVTR